MILMAQLVYSMEAEAGEALTNATMAECLEKRVAKTREACSINKYL
jgi:hypothetical protein